MRSFIALELPPAVREAAAGVIGELKRAGADVKWVRPENLHLTLKFLGEVDEAALPELIRALDEALAERPALALTASGCGSFPAKGAPNVVWLGLAGQTAELAGMARTVEAAMEPLGFVPEKRPFAAHLTLGRVRRRKGKRPPAGPGAGELKRALAGLVAWRGPEFTADRVALMQSTLTPSGPIYRPLHGITLGDQAKGEI